MATSEIILTEEQSRVLADIARQTGRSESELVDSAIQSLAARYRDIDRMALLRRARGLWKGRMDVPALAEIRGEWDRA